MVASADMAAVDMAVAVDMAAVVAAIADGTDWIGGVPCEHAGALARSGLAARPPAFALPNILKTPKRRRAL